MSILRGHKTVPMSFYRREQKRVFETLNSEEHRRATSERRLQMLDLRRKEVDRAA